MKRKGYNIIELLVVITAIALITAISYKGVNVLLNKIKAQQLISQLKQIKVGLANYYADTGTYPTKLSLLIKKDDTLPKDAAGYDAYDAISVAFYGPGNADQIIPDYWAGPYVNGMTTQGDCIKAVVGYEICYGGIYDGAFSPNGTADNSSQKITQLYKTTWASDEATGKSVKQLGITTGPDQLFHVVSINGIESEMAIKLFEELNKRSIDSKGMSLNKYNIINDIDTIGVGSSANHELTKTILYRFTKAF